MKKKVIYKSVEGSIVASGCATFEGYNSWLGQHGKQNFFFFLFPEERLTLKKKQRTSSKTKIKRVEQINRMSQEFIEDQSSSNSSDSGTYDEWIPSFCSRFGHEYFCQVPTEFIEDDFNMTGLSQEIPHYRKALDLILDLEAMSDEDDEDDNDGAAEEDGSGEPVNRSIMEHAAEQLYGLIHARYILSLIHI